ncbi:MAG: site-2 protease family protein [Bryobacterales bacterium]|nr:site-2 protease family protein [Bryobacterales bacterium]
MDSDPQHLGGSRIHGFPRDSLHQQNGWGETNGAGWGEDAYLPGPRPRTRFQRWRALLRRFRFPRLRGPWLIGLHILLFVLTILSTSLIGAGFQASFNANQPGIVLDRDIEFYEHVWANPLLLLSGFSYSLTLLTILVAHEFGHYFACVHYRIDASLPYFLPAPSLIGTLGAFIRIRQRIATTRELFDIGVAGPIAGFIFVIPALLIGVSLSKVVPGAGHAGDLVFGSPPLLHLVERLILPGVPERDILLHPMARAGLIGLLATALNLLPVGQLDGGHIVYAFLPRAHRWISRGFVLLLLPLGLLWEGWFFWAALLFFFGLKHPAVYDDRSPGAARRRIAYLSLAIFLLSFTPVPVLPR